jgi:hypothetical protein
MCPFIMISTSTSLQTKKKYKNSCAMEIYDGNFLTFNGTNSNSNIQNMWKV